MQFYNVKEQIVKHFDSRSASQRQRGKTVLDVVITDCWCVCSGTMHAPSAMNVCIVREREGRERGRERERELSVHTIYSHSGKAYRSREMHSMSGYHTYLAFRVWHLVARPDMTLTQIISSPSRITSKDNVLQTTNDNRRA